MASGNVKLEIKGLDRMQKNLKRYPKISEPIFQRATDGTAAVFAKNTLKDDPVPWRTGMLTQTFEFKSGRLQARWFPTRHYAPYVEYGTRKMLAQPFMEKIVEKSLIEVNRLFKDAADLVTKGIAKG